MFPSALVVLAVALPSAFAATLTLPLVRRDLALARSVPNDFATSSLPLIGANTVYIAALQVGTPPVQMLVTLDTGSSDLVLETAVQADSCTGCVTTGNLYNATASSTANVTSTPVDIEYLLGGDQGVVVTDIVSVGSFNFTQVFAACDKNSRFALNGAVTGLLGLGWSNVARTNSTPFIQNLWETGQLDQPLFSLAFGQKSVQDDLEGAGYLTIGGTNSSLYTGDLQWIETTNGSASGIWPMEVSDIEINGVALNFSSPKVFLDSGTNQIMLPTAAHDALYAQIPGAFNSTDYARFVYPCATNVSLAFTINGTSFAMKPETFSAGTNAEGKYCAGAVTDGGDNWILGATFMMSYYSVFRFDPPSIGLAPIADPGNTLESASISGVKTATGTATGTSPTGTSSTGSSGAQPLSQVAFGAGVVAEFALFCQWIGI